MRQAVSAAVSEITPEGSVRFCDVAQPSILAEECLLRVEAAGANFLDTLMMRGVYQGKPQPPFAPGIDVVEVFIERSRESLYAIGDRLHALIDRAALCNLFVFRVLRRLVSMAMPARDAVPFSSGSVGGRFWPCAPAACGRGRDRAEVVERTFRPNLAQGDVRPPVRDGFPLEQADRALAVRGTVGMVARRELGRD